MTDDEDLRRALQKASFEARRLAAEVDKLKYNLRKMRQELRQERAEHRQTALKLAERTDAR
jgi:uncharacterized membrane protein